MTAPRRGETRSSARRRSRLERNLLTSWAQSNWVSSPASLERRSLAWSSSDFWEEWRKQRPERGSTTRRRQRLPETVRCWQRAESLIAWELDDEWFIKTSILGGSQRCHPYVFVKCAKHKENKRVARNLEGLVCIKCAEGDEKKGDRRIERREDSDVAREDHKKN